MSRLVIPRAYINRILSSNPSKRRLALLHDLRLEGPIVVPRHRNCEPHPSMAFTSPALSAPISGHRKNGKRKPTTAVQDNPEPCWQPLKSGGLLD
jgi:hypothetical protein